MYATGRMQDDLTRKKEVAQPLLKEDYMSGAWGKLIIACIACSTHAWLLPFLGKLRSLTHSSKGRSSSHRTHVSRYESARTLATRCNLQRRDLVLMAHALCINNATSADADRSAWPQGLAYMDVGSAMDAHVPMYVLVEILM